MFCESCFFLSLQIYVYMLWLPALCFYVYEQLLMLWFFFFFSVCLSVMSILIHLDLFYHGLLFFFRCQKGCRFRKGSEKDLGEVEGGEG